MIETMVNRNVVIRAVVLCVAAAAILCVARPARGVLLNVPYFEQCDSQWSSHPLGTCALTMCSDGCAVTSAAMVYQYYGGTLTPGELNTCLTNNGGYANGCLIAWTNSCLPSSWGQKGRK